MNDGLIDAVGDERRERMLAVLRDDATDPADLSAGGEVRVIYEDHDGTTGAVCGRVSGVGSDAVHLLEANTPDTYGRALRIDIEEGRLVEVQSKYSDASRYRRTPDGGHALVSDPNGPVGSVMFVLPTDDVSDQMAHRHESGRTNFENRRGLFRRRYHGAIYLWRRTGRKLRPGDLIDRLEADGGAAWHPAFDLLGEDSEMPSVTVWDDRANAVRGRAQSLMLTFEGAGGETA